MDTYSIQDLAQACAKQTSRRLTPPRERDPCYELFRRAFAPSPDQEAWQAILNQYHRLVRLWLGQYAGDDTFQEVFLRFWRAQKNAKEPFVARFPDTESVMSYLKSCAVTVCIQVAREQDRRQKLLEQLRDPLQVELMLARIGRGEKGIQRETEFKALVLSKLKDERERVIFESSYHYALPPREVYQGHPELFVSAREVSRVKENLLKRLRRDRDLKKWWAGGGNPSL